MKLADAELAAKCERLGPKVESEPQPVNAAAKIAIMNTRLLRNTKHLGCTDRIPTATATLILREKIIVRIFADHRKFDLNDAILCLYRYKDKTEPSWTFGT
jgi:hypothetical protein